jgi:hemerythrin
MIKIEWDKKYEVGNLEIDSEHKVFVRIIQKIIHATE